MADWKEYKLSEIMELIGGGTPKTSNPEYWDGDIPWISVKDFNGERRFVGITEKTITQSGLENSSTKLLKKGDIIISARGTVGELAIIPSEMAFNQSCYGLRAKKFVDSTFLYYLLKHSVDLLKHNTHGSVFDTITRDTFESITISLPPLATQQKIETILSSLDDKIELNNKINANLEQQALALFKSWFVDFENSSDFTKKTLDEVTVNLRERILDQNTPVFSAVNTGCLQRSDDYFSKQVYSKDISKYILVKIGDFAYNPARINIGSIGINDFDYDGCVSPVYVAFSVDPSYKSFFKYYFKSNSFKEETKTRASGSVRQSLNYDDFAKIQINYPSRELVSKFEEFYTSIESSIKKIKKENETLISIRDTLLPKLMNGEIEV